MATLPTCWRAATAAARARRACARAVLRGLRREDRRRSRAPSSPSTWRPCCCRRFSARSGPTGCCIRASRRPSFRRSPRPIRRRVRAARRPRTRGQLLIELENQDLAGAAAENRAALELAEANVRDDIEGHGAAGTRRKRSSMLRAAKRRARCAAGRASTTASGCFQEGAIAQKDVNDAQVNLSQARTQYETAQKRLDDLAVRLRAIRSSRRRRRSAMPRRADTTSRRRSSATRASRVPIDGVVTDLPLYRWRNAAGRAAAS